jgi:hypothetical protein
MASSMNFAEATAIPSELTGQLPRRTRLAKNGIQSAIVLAIFLVIGVPFILWAGVNAVRLTQTRTALRQDSSEAVGRVDKKTRTGFYYSFLVNGRFFVGHASIQLQSFQVSDALPILYLPSDPSINHPAGWEEPAVLVWFPFFVPGMSLLISLAVYSSMRSDRRLVAEGRPAVATITNCALKKGGFSVKYQFRTEDGMVTKGNSSSETDQEIGASICVLYLPRNPRRNQNYTSLCYQVAQ